MTIYASAYPRIGLIGNPSDGFFGKTISLTFSDFQARVVLQESAELELLPSPQDHSRFKSLEHLARDVRLHGYYGGIRLLKATVKRFHDYCRENDIPLHRENFTIFYNSTIPHGVGLSGSSAIITATIKALMKFYGVDIPGPQLANLVLSAETVELGIAAGLQDRVVQVYEGLVYMDFDRNLMETRGYGEYYNLDPDLLPTLYMAWREELSGESGKVHSDVRQRWQMGDPEVLDAMKQWAALTDAFREALMAGDTPAMHKAINANFDLRRKLYNIDPAGLHMVETARNLGASAKFTGSGGAIVGIYEGQEMFEKLRQEFAAQDVKVIKPAIKTPEQT